MARSLTATPIGIRSLQVERYVDQVVARDGVAPSYRMIRDALDFCDIAAVCRVVAILEKRGRLRRVGRGRVRRIRLVAKQQLTWPASRDISAP